VFGFGFFLVPKTGLSCSSLDFDCFQPEFFSPAVLFLHDSFLLPGYVVSLPIPRFFFFLGRGFRFLFWTASCYGPPFSLVARLPAHLESTSHPRRYCSDLPLLPAWTFCPYFRFVFLEQSLFFSLLGEFGWGSVRVIMMKDASLSLQPLPRFCPLKPFKLFFSTIAGAFCEGGGPFFLPFKALFSGRFPCSACLVPPLLSDYFLTKGR